MSRNRRRTYALRWRRYQERCDTLVYGRDMWFMGKEYRASWVSNFRTRRDKLMSQGIPGAMIRPWGRN